MTDEQKKELDSWREKQEREEKIMDAIFKVFLDNKCSMGEVKYFLNRANDFYTLLLENYSLEEVIKRFWEKPRTNIDFMSEASKARIKI